MSDEAKAAVAGAARSGLVTASGITLGGLGSLCILGILYAAARPLWSDVQPASFALPLFALPGMAIFLAGFATAARWRGWRVWAGTVSWLMIAFTAVGTMTFLMEPIAGLTSFSERLVTVFVALAPGAVGFFALLAKQEEPTADQGVAAALTAAGIIFVLLAVLLLACGIGLAGSVAMDPTAAPAATAALVFSAVLLAMAVLYGCGALAMLRRWKRGQTLAKILAWLMIVLLLPVGLMAIITGGPRVPFPGDPIGTRFGFLIFLAMLTGPFVFVLWALRRQKSAARS